MRQIFLFFTAIGLFLGLTHPLNAQTPASGNPATEEMFPEPYGEDEFPVWANTLRRASILTFGSLPFTFLATFFTYKGVRLSSPATESGNFLPVGELNSDDRYQVLYISLGVSLTIAVVDFILGLVFDNA